MFNKILFILLIINNLEAIETKKDEVYDLNICLNKLMSFEFNKDCILIVISKGIGLSIVLFSLIYKVPQIINIVNNKSLKGIAFISVFIEIFSVLITIIYFYLQKISFSNYGENIFNFIQTYLILLFYMVYEKNYSKKIIISTIILGAYSYFSLNGYFSQYFLDIFYSLNFFLCKIISGNRKMNSNLWKLF